MIMTHTRVGHVNHDLKRADAVRIDRRTKWGNPYPITPQHSRDDVIRLYKQWLWREIKDNRITVEELRSLYGKVLCCHCHPRPCHGDVLAAAADWAASL